MTRSGGTGEYDNGSDLKLVTKFYDKEFSLNFHTAFSFNKNLDFNNLPESLVLVLINVVHNLSSR